MEIGKLTNEALEGLIFAPLKQHRNEVIKYPAIGEDCALLNFSEDHIVLSTDPITGTAKNIGYLAVHIACNDIAASGGEPVGLTMTILAPPQASSEELALIMKDAQRACDEIDVDIVGGHTEVTDAVNRFVLSCTAIGKAKTSLPGIQAGDVILMTKEAGIEGTSIIAYEKEEALKELLSEEELVAAKELGKLISVKKEGVLGASLGVHEMHDVTEGGIYGAVYELAAGKNLGFTLEEEAIPVHKLTRTIADHYQISPYKLISSGAMILVCHEDKASELMEAISKEGIQVSKIGTFTQNPERIIISKHGTKPAQPPQKDELYHVL